MTSWIFFLILITAASTQCPPGLAPAAITRLNDQTVFLPQVTTAVLFDIGGNNTQDYSFRVNATLQGGGNDMLYSNEKKWEDLGGVFATAENRTMNNKSILIVLLYSTNETVEQLIRLDIIVYQNIDTSLHPCLVSPPNNSFEVLYQEDPKIDTLETKLEVKIAEVNDLSEELENKIAEANDLSEELENKNAEVDGLHNIVSWLISGLALLILLIVALSVSLVIVYRRRYRRAEHDRAIVEMDADNGDDDGDDAGVRENNVAGDNTGARRNNGAEGDAGVRNNSAEDDAGVNRNNGAGDNAGAQRNNGVEGDARVRNNGAEDDAGVRRSIKEREQLNTRELPQRWIRRSSDSAQICQGQFKRSYSDRPPHRCAQHWRNKISPQVNCQGPELVQPN